ncbi:hypothetical protein ACFXGA_06095 [Actinosynnema sp. NPDC059335]|uniref:hypothetical protein n=1 Tax=Actinosynnema sp. NPDC059335 TaxID=3346804 RepID=UPI00366E78C1
MGVALLMDHDTGNGRWTAAYGEITGVPVSSHGDWALQVAGSAVPWRRAVLARLQAQGGAEQWYVRFRCRLTGTTGSTPAVFGGVRLLDETGSVIPVSALPSRSSFTKDGWMVVEGRVSRDTAARYLVAATAELYVGVQGLAASQQVSFDEVTFRQVATNVLIADAAIDDAKIQSLSVSKLTAGTMTASVIVAGELKSGDTGARYLLNASGFKLFNSSGSNTVSLNNDGTASFSGTIGSVDIVGYARVINPLQGSQMYMHPGLGGSRYPLLAADTGLLTPTWPGVLQLYNGQLMQDQIWQLLTPRVSWFGTGDPSTTYEVSAMQMGLITNSTMNTTDPALWPTKIGGFFRITVPYGSTSAPAGYTIRARPFWEFLHDYRTPSTPLAQGADLAGYAGFHWGNKYGQTVGIRIFPTGPGTADSAMEFVRDNSNAFATCYAAAWQTASHSSHKTEIGDLPFSALEVVEANPARRWRYHTDRQFHVGPMADHLPDEVAPGQERLDHTSAIGLLWAAVSELAAEVRGG